MDISGHVIARVDAEAAMSNVTAFEVLKAAGVTTKDQLAKAAVVVSFSADAGAGSGLHHPVHHPVLSCLCGYLVCMIQQVNTR